MKAVRLIKPGTLLEIQEIDVPEVGIKDVHYTLPLDADAINDTLDNLDKYSDEMRIVKLNN